MSSSKIIDKGFGLDPSHTSNATQGMFWLRAIAKNIMADVRRRRDMRHLEAMSDHELRDIGLDRADIAVRFHRRRKAFPPPRI
jgi:uncharacterized protein YjiS (DUF1127 family)